MALVTGVVVVGLAAQAPQPGPEGTWKGTLGSGASSLHLVLRITKSPDGGYAGSLDSVDQHATIPIERISVTGDSVRFELPAVGATFEGTLNPARTELAGFLTQGSRKTLVFTREAAAPATTRPALAATTRTIDAAFPLGLPLDLQVPVRPTPFLGNDGRTYVVYELHVTNLGDKNVPLTRLDVLSGTSAIASYEGDELNRAIGAGTTGVDHRTVAAGRRVVVFLWMVVDSPAAVPASWTHRVTVGELSVDGAQVSASGQTPVVISAPLSGSGWTAVNGPGPESAHRRALIPIEGGMHLAQRFAIDWVQIGPNGQTFSGDVKDNRNYRAYGATALAVADGIVAEVKDGIPENVPGVTSRAVAINADTVGGNHVMLDLGGGRFAFYAHLQPGSLRVKLGDRVTRGQVLGLVGNSGNSTEPHLHFHISDGPSPLGSEGLPYAITGMAGLPLQNTRVDFGK